jgi:hypothetical protein
MSVQQTSFLTILSSADLQNYWEISVDPRLARREGRIIVALLEARRLVRVWGSCHALSHRDLIAGQPGAIVGLRTSSRPSEHRLRRRARQLRRRLHRCLLRRS